MQYLKLLVKNVRQIPLYYKSMDFKSLFWLFKSPIFVRRCILYLNAEFKTVDNKTVITIKKYNNLHFYIKTASDMFIILEVFFKTSYKILFHSKAILIDIGLNIADTYLFFSQYENIEHIYAFEPFKETYEQALYNLNLNRISQDKITAYNYGLLGKDEDRSVLYSPKFTNGMSIINENSQFGVSKKNMYYQSVILKSADREISNIISKTNKNIKIILKIDCEGSEYEIIDSLNRSGILKRVDCILDVLIAY
jgi:FkbM family methyltransferase